jgi:uracil-DNA glycosylase family 4
VAYRESIAKFKRRAFMNWEYWGKPVPAFGDFEGRLLAVGLAPGAHGSNRTGRMFTGDASGNFLYHALCKVGLSNQSISISRDDGMELCDLVISAVCRCVPPGNKPNRKEMENCLPYLEHEVKLMPNLQGFIALGRIAFKNILIAHRVKGITINNMQFKHGELYRLGEGLPWLLASFHPSQQNTQTGRLTVQMFDQIWQRALELLE